MLNLGGAVTYAPDLIPAYAYDAHAQLMSCSKVFAYLSPLSSNICMSCSCSGMMSSTISFTCAVTGHTFSTHSTSRGTASTPPVYYYGYRYYSPMLGRWLSRDPIGEYGGINIYCSGNNDLIGRIEILGLWPTYGPCSDAGEDDIPLDGWEIDTISYDRLLWAGDAGLVEQITFSYERKFKRKYICCCNKEDWAEGKRGINKTDRDIYMAVMKVPSTYLPPPGTTIYKLLLRLISKGLPIPEVIADIGYLEDKINLNRPAESDQGEIVEEPSAPNAFCW